MACIILALLALVAPASASDTPLSGREGHPRDRLPLRVWIQPAGDAALDAALRRAIDDWNTLARDALGIAVFLADATREATRVRISVEPATAGGLMGVTYLRTDDTGAIETPVSITVVEPTARGQTSRETLLYQVAAHELGHALGLPHVRDPRSVMCCDTGAVDFNDPVVREAYIEARRHPDLRSVREELIAHYTRFWRR
ncbi:MAG TPA: matrixin family metalloprotease [Methylomirabilota bacterium]|nr:matrixin family metalloprotease [Methylomirabilota bacterium]